MSSAEELTRVWPSSGPVDPPLGAVRRAVRVALREDLGVLGDLTASLVPDELTTDMFLVSRCQGVLAGRLCADESFRAVDTAISVDWLARDGDLVKSAMALAHVSGPMCSVLTSERTALNFLCHLSGIATLTRSYADAVGSANPATRITDTRKTTPGLRALEKAAVRAGGGFNHRSSLSEAVLIKDNHIGALGITEAVRLARRWWPMRMVEVECERLEQVAEALDAGAGTVMLDNMTPHEVARCVAMVRERCEPGTVLVEVSGGVTLESAPGYASAGADLISIGALTHSAPALDIGLDLQSPSGDSAGGTRSGDSAGGTRS